MGSDIISIHQQRELIARISRLVERRAREEQEVRAGYSQAEAAARADFDAQRNRAIADFEARQAQLIAAYLDAREKLLSHYESEGDTLARQERRQTKDAHRKHAKSLEEAKMFYDDRCQHIGEMFTRHEAQLKQEHAQFVAECDAHGQEIEALAAAGRAVIVQRGLSADLPAPPPLPRAGLDQRQLLIASQAEFATARNRLAELQQVWAARFVEEGWPVLIFIFAALAAIYPLWLLLAARGWIWILGAAAATGGILALAAWLAMRPLAKRQTLHVAPLFLQAIQQARHDLATALHVAHAALEQAHAKLASNRDERLTAATLEIDRFRTTQQELLQTQLAETTRDFASRRAGVVEHYEQELDALEAQAPREIEALERSFEEAARATSQAYRERRAADRTRYHDQWQALVAAWNAGLGEFESAIVAMNQYCDVRFPAWPAVGDPAWQPPAKAELPALCFGRYQFPLSAVASAPPEGESLPEKQTTYDIPAVLSFPTCPSLLIEAEDAGREAAAQLVRNVMLRLLTSLPPGKVRFTIIDPVGLGQNFSAFMHLADHDERLVASRIWTEAAHIQQRLTDLTEHMENVIQKYLRNEFESIQEYNEQAGEVAEPFQILVVANFPANFSDEAARRLASIAASGARCGVYTLVSVDIKQKLPRNFDLADLEASAATLVWNAESNSFRWKYDDLAALPLALETPPDDDTFTEIVRNIGRRAKDAARVEVPFATVTPAVEEMWQRDSRHGIEVPLGRAGARKLQSMRLGKGTSQHVLIAGKTGSGKSTLLNAMITNLALYYSPTELLFYLIDFKKGVEFKAYAELKLPHARVVAIESEREFGLSVLERLDLELKRRGDLFRAAGVQNVAGYRDAQPAVELPRILLIIDEFQEFFTTDDRISHDASLLLDRLVRQGRAFGIHVLLGSQTLAGAYSLARSTIGQMAVRIALQCSESDAHLILSEDNTAARLLSRPGEAIYNDANGLFEGNHPFQVVWLSDEERETYLRRVEALSRERGLVLPKPTIFEGSAPADPSENDALRELLERPAETSFAPRAWLGAAVAIKEPTHAIFARQSGGNLLVVGQQEELALGMLSNALIALAAQSIATRSVSEGDIATRSVSEGSPPSTNGHPAHPHILILDGVRPESPLADFWPSFARSAALAAKIVTPRESAAAIASVAAELDRRITTGDATAEPLYVVIANLARFRDLKKSDDYGFSLSDDGGEGTSADKQLATILREGPAHGVHVLVWCDSFNNANRWFDRQTLRDLSLRVLFQMGATDSSNLMDSPAASRLGMNLAILYSEEQGEAEKFRPYGLPSDEWLAWVAEKLKQEHARQ